jgi:hypothetical protein
VFFPLSYVPPTVPRDEDPQRTDLVATAFDGTGRGWVAGVPTGFRFASGSPNQSGRSPGTLTEPEPSPLLPVSPLARARGCAGPARDRFTWSSAGTDAPTGHLAYLWTSLSVFPSSGDALAGGTLRPAEAAPWRNESAREPLLVRVTCRGTVTETRFRIPDRTWDEVGDPPLVPADRRGWISSVAGNAENDAWAASTPGALDGRTENGIVPTNAQRPRFYHFTDGAPPAAPAGDDEESRPPVFVADPPIFVEESPPPEPEELPAPPPVVQPPPAAPAPRKLLPAVYGVKSSKPRKTNHGFILYVSFKVRRPVTIGVEGLRRESAS